MGAERARAGLVILIARVVDEEVRLEGGIPDKTAGETTGHFESPDGRRQRLLSTFAPPILMHRHPLPLIENHAAIRRAERTGHCDVAIFKDLLDIWLRQSSSA